MANHTLTKQPDKTVQITVTIPWNDLQKEKGTSFEKLHKDLAIEGFRKGKVPKSLAEKHIKEEDLFNDALQRMIPQIYEDIVKKEKLKPIISPKVQLLKAQKEEDWEIEIKTAEAPDIDVSDYKKIIEKVKKDSKTQDIWTPGKEESKEKAEEKKGKKLDSILKALLDGIPCEISDLIVEEEVNKRLSQLVDDVRKVGLSVDEYVKSKNLTMDQLKEQYAKEIKDTYKFEFILQQIADKEKISVDQKEIESFILQIKESKDQEIAKQNMYFYATIMRKQKVLDYLNSL